MLLVLQLQQEVLLAALQAPGPLAPAALPPPSSVAVPSPDSQPPQPGVAISLAATVSGPAAPPPLSSSAVPPRPPLADSTAVPLSPLLGLSLGGGAGRYFVKNRQTE